jgi:DNA polymerase III subunit delta
MQLKGAAAAQALARPDPAIRLYVLGGPDEAGSRAMMADFAKAMGQDSERTDFTPARLKEDPALLADEAASIGLFGGRRWIAITLFSGGGDDILAACETLLAAPAAGNPAIVVGAGITAKSKLAKLAESHAAAVLAISYPPEGRDAARIAEAVAAPLGLKLGSGVAAAIIDATGGDRGLIEREVEKLALYCDADTDEPQTAEIDDWRAIGADLPEEDLGAAVNIILEGRLGALPQTFATLEATGSGDIRLLRALARRAVELLHLRVHVEQGRSPAQVMESHGRGIFWKEKAHVSRQIGLWDAVRVAKLVERLHALERAMKMPDNAGVLLLRAGLLDICRVAASAAR